MKCFFSCKFVFKRLKNTPRNCVEIYSSCNYWQLLLVLVSLAFHCMFCVILCCRITSYTQKICCFYQILGKPAKEYSQICHLVSPYSPVGQNRFWALVVGREKTIRLFFCSYWGLVTHNVYVYENSLFNLLDYLFINCTSKIGFLRSLFGNGDEVLPAHVRDVETRSKQPNGKPIYTFSRQNKTKLLTFYSYLHENNA